MDGDALSCSVQMFHVPLFPSQPIRGFILCSAPEKDKPEAQFFQIDEICVSSHQQNGAFPTVFLIRVGYY